jgi:Ca2+-binding RTX toxin-like protein
MTDTREPQFLTYDETYLAFMNRTLSPGHATGPTSFWDWATANELDPGDNYALANFHGFRDIGKGAGTKPIFFNILDALSSSYISSSLQSVMAILDEIGIATTTMRPDVPEGLQSEDFFYTVNLQVDIMEEGDGSTVPFTNGGSYVDGAFIPPEEWIGANMIIDVYSSYGPSTLLHEVLHAIGQGHTYCHGIDFPEGTEPDTSFYLPGEASRHEAASNMRYTEGHTNQSILPASLELLWRTTGVIPDAIHAEDTTHTFDGGLFRENIIDTGGIDTLVVGNARYYDKSLLFPSQVFGHIINLGLWGVSFLNYGQDSYASLLTIMGQVNLPNGADEFTGSVIENLVSGDGHDTIWGNHVANDITAGDGDNLVYGLDGNDTLRSGEGNDEVYGGIGNDLFASGSGVDWLYGGEDTDTFQVDSNLLDEGAWFDGGDDGAIDTVHVFGGSSITLDGDMLNGTTLVGIERLVLDWSLNEGVVDHVTRLMRGTQGLLVEMGTGSDTWSSSLTGDTVDGGGGSYTDTLQLAVVSDTVLFTGLSNQWSAPGLGISSLSSVSLTASDFELVEISGPITQLGLTMANPASFPASAMTITFTDVDVAGGERVSLVGQGGQRLWIDGRGVDGATTMRAAGPGAAGSPTQSFAPTGETWTVEGVGTITGGTGDDMILGGLGQSLHGGSGNDTLDLRLASDASGGAGADTFRWLPTSASTPLLQTITDAVAPPPYPNNPTSAQLTAWRAQVAQADSLVVTGLAALGDLVWSDVAAGAVGEGSGAGALLTHIPTGRLLLVEGLTAAVAATLLTGGLVGDWVGTAWADSPTAGGFTANTRAFGLDGNDVLTTVGGNVSLYGGAGNDTLHNSSGTATLYGGAGNDLFLTNGNKNYSGSTVSYADVINPVGGNANAAPGVANGVVMGNTRTVTQDGFGGTDTLEIDFAVGNNAVVGSRFNDSMATISHTVRTTSSMRLDGGEGHDTLMASGYQDQLYGGNGNDELSSASGERTGNFGLYGGAGDDKLWARGNASNDGLYGGAGNDRLSGLGGGGDNLSGGDGDDLLITGSGSAYNMDTLHGGAGSDVVALLSSGGNFGRTATINGFTPGVDVWVVNADAAGRYVHTNATTPDFARVIQVGADVHVGKTASGAGETIAVFKGVLRADVISAFGGIQSNVDAYWLARLGAASGGVSADGESALGGDGPSMLDGNTGGTNLYLLPGEGEGDGTSFPGSNVLDRAEWLEMEAQAHEDLLAGLNASGTTAFLFEDPTWAWVLPVLVEAS